MSQHGHTVCQYVFRYMTHWRAWHRITCRFQCFVVANTGGCLLLQTSWTSWEKNLSHCASGCWKYRPLNKHKKILKRSPTAVHPSPRQLRLAKHGNKCLLHWEHDVSNISRRYLIGRSYFLFKERWKFWSVLMVPYSWYLFYIFLSMWTSYKTLGWCKWRVFTFLHSQSSE